MVVDAAHGVVEVEREVGGDVGAALRARRPRRRSGRPGHAAPAPEHLAEQVADVAVVHVADVEREPAGTAAAEPAGHRAEPADLVVLLALGLVAEHVVRGRRPP